MLFLLKIFLWTSLLLDEAGDAILDGFPVGLFDCTKEGNGDEFSPDFMLETADVLGDKDDSTEGSNDSLYEGILDG